MGTPRRERSVLQHLNLIVKDLEATIEQSSSKEEWRALVRSTVMHWMNVMFDEGSGYTKDLETSIRILQRQVRYLKKQQTDQLKKDKS